MRMANQFAYLKGQGVNLESLHPDEVQSAKKAISKKRHGRKTSEKRNGAQMPIVLQKLYDAHLMVPGTRLKIVGVHAHEGEIVSFLQVTEEYMVKVQGIANGQLTEIFNVFPKYIQRP